MRRKQRIVALMDFTHSEPSFQAERIHDLPQGQLGAGPEGARPAARQELHEAEGAAPRRPARALASLPGRSEAEHPGAAGGEIWAGHHERSLTGEKQRKSWGPATQEPRGNHAGTTRETGKQQVPTTREHTPASARGHQRPPSGRGHVPRDPPLSCLPSTPAEGAVPGSRRPSHCAWGSNSRNPRLQG